MHQQVAMNVADVVVCDLVNGYKLPSLQTMHNSGVPFICV